MKPDGIGKTVPGWLRRGGIGIACAGTIGLFTIGLTAGDDLDLVLAGAVSAAGIAAPVAGWFMDRGLLRRRLSEERTDRRRAEAALRNALAKAEESTDELRETKQRFELAVRGSKDALWDWDLTNDKVYYAPRWLELLGLDEVGDTPDEWISRIVSEDLERFQGALADAMGGRTEAFECELRMEHGDGTMRWVLCRGAVYRNKDDQPERVAGSLAEIGEIKQAQEELRHATEHDRLTLLYNREAFMQHVERAHRRSLRDVESRFAVIFLDFDRFKIVNDSLGHDAGDTLLCAIAERLRDHMRGHDVAARFGGDEFAVLLTDLRDNEDALRIGERLLESFAQPHNLRGHEVVSTASAGLVTSEMGYESAEAMLRDADAAMYQAKAAGRGQIVLFDSAMHDEAIDRLKLEEDLRDALERREFFLVYQPIVSLENGSCTGFEALIRWNHPTRGLVRPDKFIPIAEDTGLIIDIGLWTLNEAVRQLAEWDRLGDHYSMNVNVSKRQLCHPEILPAIEHAIRESGIDPARLKIEITESTIVDNRSDMIPTLQRIKETGVRLAMDDFGTGHSSLSGLHRFPIDVLKIDQSFVRSMEESHQLAAVIHAIVTLAQHLGMDVVAEGVETEDQVAALQAHGCNFAQGYLFAKPMPASDVEGYLGGAVGRAA